MQVNINNYDIVNHIADYNYRDEVRQEVYEILTLLSPSPDDYMLYRLEQLKKAWAEMLDEYEREVWIENLRNLFSKK